jgi:membrane protease YdiL (CAAX protease family)
MSAAAILTSWLAPRHFLLSPHMRALLAIVIYIAVVFVGGALLAPVLYWLAESLSHGHPQLAAIPFHRFVNRSILLLSLIGLWPLFKQLGMTSLRDIGLAKPAGNGKLLGAGLLLGFALIALVAAAEIAFGVRRYKVHLTAAGVTGKLLGAAMTALAVSVIEEILYRGAVFGSLRKVFHWSVALALSSVLYALLHFLAPAEATGPITWHSGLELLPPILRGMIDWQTLIPACLSLTVAGMLLGLAYQRTGNLYFSIGLHAGWIFALKTYANLTFRLPDMNSAWWGTAKLVDGWLALLLLGMTLLICSRLPLTRKAELPA